MSIKKLFESTNKVQEFVSDASTKDLFDEGAESVRNVEQKKLDQDRFVPQIDFSKPENFAKYGSARLYYKSALTRITDYYPYDGSEAEINQFLNESLDIERYILDNQYPRTTGYITLGLGSTYNGTITDGYGDSTATEHIDFLGGPGTGSAASSNLKDLIPRDKDSKYNYSNIYDESIYTTAGLPTDYGTGTRTSNLRSNFDDGVTVEFWLKTGSLNPANQTNKQVVFDMWNQDTSSANARMMIELTSSHAATADAQRPFLVTVQSGSHTTKTFLSLGQAVLHSSSGDWNHYSIRVFNTGSNFKAQLYVNGHLNDTALRQPYDLATTKIGLLATAYNTTSARQERAWPHAIENGYSSAENLQGWWRLNNSSSALNRVDDMSGRSRHGIFTDPGVDKPTIDTTNFPSAYIQGTTGSMNFDGVSGSPGSGANKIFIGDAEVWDAIIGNDTAGGSTEKMTLAAWIRPEGLGEANLGRIIDFGVGDISLFMADDGGGGHDILFRATWSGGASEFRINDPITLNEWTHVAVTYDATDSANVPVFYINGVAVAFSGAAPGSGTFSGITESGGTDPTCCIGNNSNAGKTFDGQIADVAVWNSILSANEIRSIYSAYNIKTTTHTVGELGPKNLKARIGALQTTAPGSSAAANTGRLSGSLDEFRFWKTKRTSKQIGTNWFKQVRGGANSDISNTTLGVYYKFNEGITGDSSTDSVVLDYAGRVTNGVWTGYTATARNTGSAILSASAATKEYLDPIIRTNHPSYINLQSALLNSGSAHDMQNNGSLLNLVPAWIIEQDNETDDTDLKYITHVMGAYFDKLYNQIKELPKLRHQTHTSGTFKPISFAEHLPQSLGLYVPEVFVDADVMEKFANHSENIIFENELKEAKNLIYQNLYNSLTDIYKSKGTEQAIKNVLKCFNIDDKLLKLKVNSNNTEFILRNNLQQHLVRKNFLNFSHSPNNGGVIYQKVLSSDFLPPGINQALRAGVVSGNTNPGPFRYDTTGDGAIDLILPGFQAPYGHTHEANILFPYYDKENAKQLKLRPNFKQMSLFGTVTPKNSVDGKSGADLTTETTNNYADFKVYFVRDETESRSGFFKLVAQNPDDSQIILTSSVFNDVYNNELWNLSVRIKPFNYPLNTFVSGNVSELKAGTKNKYEVIFSGYNAKTENLFDSFRISSEVSTATGTRMIGSLKRLYAGAHRTNVIGNLQYNSDVMISSLASWSRFIEDSDLKQHALDIENVGLSGSNQHMFALDQHNVFKETMRNNSLVLNWNFRSASTTSTAGGIIYVQDFSSGSVGASTGDFGWMGQQSGLYYQAEGRFFEPSSTKHLPKKRVNSFKFIDPERPISSDMVQIFSEEDDLTPKLRRQEILPNFVYSLEKSLYDAVSEEMLDFFAGVIDFNDIIGHPVHSYRHQYKEMEKIRDVFFRRVTATSTVEKYTEYYKWFDDALTTIISQLIPASGEYINDAQNVIESHVLERNKYQNKLNIFDSNKYQLDRIAPPAHLLSPTVMAAGGVVDYTELATVKASSPRKTNRRAEFWKRRADRTSEEITSGNPIVDQQRNKFRDVIFSTPFVSSSELSFAPTLATIDGTKYTPSAYTTKRTTDLFSLNVSAENKSSGKNLPHRLRNITSNIKSGVNFERSKNFDFAASITRPAGPINHEGGKFVPLNVMVGFVADSTPIPVVGVETRPLELIVKQKKTFKVQTGRDWETGLGYKNVKSGMAFPFNVFSSSVEVNSGYNAQVTQRVGKNLMITNVHNDVYGDQLEKPMQGVFTNDVVGGHQSRHIGLNMGNDQQNNRPEAWRILLGTCEIVPSGAIGVVGADYPPANYNPPAGTRPYPYPHHGKAYLYRDNIAKRPVNIRNIHNQKNNKTVPGNFQEQYEVIHSFGAFHNARAFVENQPTLPSQLSEVNSTTNVRSLLSIRRNSNSHFDLVGDYSTAYLSNNLNKTIIINRFSAPGGIEVMSKGYLDFKSSEMSPYNALGYRNLTVIKPSQGPSGTISKVAVAGDAGNIQVADIHNKDYGLRSHLARHSAKFGRDSLFVSNPGASKNELPSFHKINRNARQVIISTNENNSVFVTSSKFDNAFVQRPIPQSDRQYMWLSNSVQDVTNIKYAGFQNVGKGTEFNPFRTSSAGIQYYWTFVTGSDAIPGRRGKLFQPTNPLNIIIEDPITSSTHTIGFPATVNISNYTNKTLVGNTPNIDYLNQLLTSRGDTYGWSWRKTHQSNHRVLAEEKRTNQLVIATGSGPELSTHRLVPVSMKGRPSYINFDVLVAEGTGAANINTTLKFTNTNEKIFFNDLDLNNYAEINHFKIHEPYKDAIQAVRSNPLTSLNWFLYKQNMFPSLKNEFGPFSSKRVGYDNKFWRNSRADRTTLGNTLSSSIIGNPVNRSSWPLDAPANFLTRTSIYSPTSGSALTSIPSVNDNTYFTSETYTPLTGNLAYNINVPAAGELQNTYFGYFTVNIDGPRFIVNQLAPLYARKHALGTPHSVVSPGGVKIAETGSWGGISNTGFDLTKQLTSSFLAGEALWEAADQAGIVVPGSSSTGFVDRKLVTTVSSSVFVPSASNPWYNDYDDFKSDLRLMAKGYAIVPEYRMSEHVKDYFNFGINNKSKQNMFEIVGTNSSSANDNFYIDYSNSDFLENFLGIKKASLLNAKEIKLTCNAAIKYNPYKGFYPAQRTVDLSKQFVESFKDSIGGSFSGSQSGLFPFNNQTYGVSNILYQRGAGVLKTMLDPLISPGILYNSIKSGIAVDYPIVSNHRKRLRRAYGTNSPTSTQNWALSITGAATDDTYVSGSGQYLGGQYWDKRIPFEAIIEPRKYILNTAFVDMESHPSMSLDWNWNNFQSGIDAAFELESFTGSFSDNADGVYSLMARNFFGACGEFFLESSGITKLESNVVLNDLQFTKDSNFASSRPLYMARIKLRRSHNGARTYDKEYDSYGNVGAQSYYAINGAQRTINGTQSVGTYSLPQDPMSNPLFKETFTMYSRPTAFGPPCAGRPTGSNANVAPFNNATKDSFSGFNPAFTPPYYDGEAWADLIFRPHVIDKSDTQTAAAEPYDLNRILNETQVVCWRFDAGENKQIGDSTKTSSMPVLIPVEQTQLASFIGITPENDHTVPSIYDGKRINANSMQLTSSVKIFGTKKVLEQQTDKFGNVTKNVNKPVGTKWIIQPKWETPMLNFNDEGVHPITAENGTLTLPTYASASVPRGMWHQFGVIPDEPNKGIFLEITDIPEDWLRSHYEVLADDRETPYNGNAFGSQNKNKKRINLYKHVRSLSSLCGFDQTNSSTKLGQIKESLAVHEAIVAVPYLIEEVDELLKENIPTTSKFRKTRKKFVSIPKRRFGATRDQAAGSAQGDSLEAAGESLRKLKQNMEKYVFPPEFDFLNNKEVDPIAMYVFEFKYEFDRDDLSYIWQNLAPRDHEKVMFQESSISHNLTNNELINEEILNNDNLRWMVFKVKQRCKTDYYDLIVDQANESTRQIEQKTTDLDDYKFGFNWPYDYLSFVELIKMDVQILFKKDE